MDINCHTELYSREGTPGRPRNPVYSQYAIVQFGLNRLQIIRAFFIAGIDYSAGRRLPFINIKSVSGMNLARLPLVNDSVEQSPLVGVMRG